MPQQTVPRPGLEPGVPWSVVCDANHCASPPYHLPFRVNSVLTMNVNVICRRLEKSFLRQVCEFHTDIQDSLMKLSAFEAFRGRHTLKVVKINCFKMISLNTDM